MITVVDVDALPDRLRQKIAFGPGCWEWLAGRDEDGYGKYRHGGRKRMAHRVVYELLIGPIPDGLQIDHLCRVRHCVNPDHMEPVTGRVNVLRGETFCAENAAKSVCDAGHPYDEANTHVYIEHGSPRRKCRACDRDRRRAYRSTPAGRAADNAAALRYYHARGAVARRTKQRARRQR